MSVLIDGMEMPSTCEECNLESFCGKWIEARKMCEEWNPEVKATIRHPDCPLSPVPAHGRLIDADALIRELEITEEDDRNGATLLMAVFLEVLKSAPTVIPAEPCNNLSKPCKDAHTFTSTATIPCDLSHPMSGYTSSSNYTEGKT